MSLVCYLPCYLVFCCLDEPGAYLNSFFTYSYGCFFLMSMNFQDHLEFKPLLFCPELCVCHICYSIHQHNSCHYFHYCRLLKVPILDFQLKLPWLTKMKEENWLILSIFRIENISIRQIHGIAKILGSAVGLTGALTFTFVKGPPMYPAIHNKISHFDTKNYSKEDWIKGSLLMLLANLTWSLWIIMQVKSKPFNLLYISGK